MQIGIIGAVGAPTKGIFLESSAVPAIRSDCARVATGLLRPL